MRPSAVAAVALKEWRHLRRDPTSLALLFLMPAMLLALFGYAIRLDIREAPLGVLVESPDGAARALVADFDASAAFRVARHYRSRAALGAALARGEVWAGLVVPAGYARALVRGRARVQLLLDGTDANTARLLRNYAELVVQRHAEARGVAPPLALADRLWFNQARESRYAIVPGVITLVMAVVGTLMTALAITREREQGSLALLRASPLRRGELLAGKLVPYFVIGIADVALAAAAAVWVFDVPLRGSPAALMAVSALFLLVVMLQGTLISLQAPNQVMASQMATVTSFLPAFLLSGFIFAIENMPAAIRVMTYVVPARYHVALSKAIFLKGAGPLLLWADVVALGAVAAAFGVAVWRRAARLGLLP